MSKKIIKKSWKIAKIQDNKVEQSCTTNETDNSKVLSLELKEKLEDPEKLRNTIAFLMKGDIRPDGIYDKAKEIILNMDYSEDNTKFLNEKCVYLNSYNKNHYILAEVESHKARQSAMIEYANDLIKEYDCKTPSENALCEIITNSYFQILRINRRMTSTMDAWEYLSNNRNNYINVLSKELERANRSYLYSLNTLREIKSPKMSINVKTKNAFIWTNQQFNNNQTQDENIKD